VYEAVNVWFPFASVEVETVAVPFVSVAVPREAFPSLKVTVPVLAEGFSVALNVTL